MMKPLKAAAVVAGSLAVVGAGAPAFAAGLVPTGVTDLATDTVSKQPLLADSPVSTNALDPSSAGSVTGALNGATGGLDSGGGNAPMLGGLPLGG
ncbi:MULTISPECIES: hypothetical protein [Streptomyces]|nr:MULTISPECIES: hypothetical protein [Streptomyces]